MDQPPKDCPTRPKEAVNQRPNTSLNYIGVVLSPGNSESKTDRVLVKVVTRAQSRKNTQEQSEPNWENSKGIQTRQKCLFCSKGSKKSKGEPQASKKSPTMPNLEQGETNKHPKPNDHGSSKSSLGGFMIVGRVNKPL